MKRRVTRRRVDTGVAFHRLASGKKRLIDKRTIRVLGSLVVGMTLVSAILLALEPNPTNKNKAWALSAIDMTKSQAKDEILGVEGDREWQFIIIHDSRGQTGGLDSLNNAYKRYYAAKGTPERDAGYHFVISDKTGQDGVGVEIANRWKDQQHGDYITGDRADYWNRQAIGICLMGDADSKPFEADQIETTIKLVRMLQEAYDIPRERVFIQTGQTEYSRSSYFPSGEFRKQIRD